MKDNIWFVMSVIIMELSVELLVQMPIIANNDSVFKRENSWTVSDTLSVPNFLSQSFHSKPFSPTPIKASVYSVFFPGLGQIYNRKYWKLPIVYGSFGGCICAIYYNSHHYYLYKHAYRDSNDDRLKIERDFYRQNRDLGYTIIVGLYALCIIDAYVDAQLFGFDVSENLSLRINPVFFDKVNSVSYACNIQLHIVF